MKRLVAGKLLWLSYCWPTALRTGKRPARRLVVAAVSNDNAFAKRSIYRAMRRWHRDVQEEKGFSHGRAAER